MFVAHPLRTVHRALELADRGLSATDVARALRIPRSTARDWLAGLLPTALRDEARCPVCGERPHAFGELGERYAYLLGMYLGDGNLAVHPRGVHKLRVALDVKYPGIISETRAAIAAVRPRNSVRVRRCAGNWVEVYSYAKAWPCLLPQHGAGAKHLRPIELAPWQYRALLEAPEALLRGLIHSDGCRFTNTGRGGWSNPRYRFDNRSADIRRIFCDTCELLGVAWTTSGDTIYVSRKADVAKLDVFIGPKLNRATCRRPASAS